MEMTQVEFIIVLKYILSGSYLHAAWWSFVISVSELLPWLSWIYTIKNNIVSVSRSVTSDSLQPHGLYRLFYPWDSPGKNTGVGFHSLLQGIFLIQGLNRSLLHYRQILYHLSQPGSPYCEETIIQKDTCTPVFIAALFTIVSTWTQPRCTSTDEWIKKLWYVYTMEYYSAIKGTHLSQF